MIKSTDGFFKIKGNKEYLPDYKSLLSDSIFYPGCGLDNIDLQLTKSYFNVYVHADYRVTKTDAEYFLNNVQGIDDYALENIYEFDRSILFPVDNSNIASLMPTLPVKKSEEDLFEKYQLLNLKTPDTFLMGVYILDESSTNKIVKSPFTEREYSMPPLQLVFFFYEDAITLFNALYFYNKVNPLAVALSNNFPDNPYWTNLVADDQRFRVSLLINHLYNNCRMPQFLITDISPSHEQNSVERFEWKEYYLLTKHSTSNSARNVHFYRKDLLLL
jgi:hypothetical protein